MKKTVIIISTTALICLLLLFGAYLDLIFYGDRPTGDEPEKKIITVERGQSFAVTAEKLHLAGLIESPVRFRILARLKKADKRIQAGEYLLAADMSPKQILTVMVSGKVRLYKYTVPEGYNYMQIASIVDKAGFTPAEEFIKAAADPGFVHRMGIEADTFEGYLFPDTYHFPRGAGPQEIISAMVARLRSLIPDQWKTRATQLGFSFHQILTLASIIEKETGAPFERPIISSVFHNRLQKGMRLETDPTVIYGIKEFDGNITRKHLTTPTPYNTYKIKGLPPGPIANPGLASIEAALYPADTDYLFFVAKKDTTHQFSANLRDHNRAIRKYQLRRRK